MSVFSTVMVNNATCTYKAKAPITSSGKLMQFGDHSVTIMQ